MNDMKKKASVLILFVLLSYLNNKGFSQMSISYYSSSLSKIGLGYNINERWWSELRLYSNTTVENITPELVLLYTIVKKDKHTIYVGLGGNVNFFNGLVVPIGVQFSPLEKLDKFAFHIEFQPTIDFESSMILQSSWGLRYRFGKDK
jgi:hypothetical protein